MPGQDLIWYGTTGQPGTADGQANSNPLLYLGDFRSSQVLHSLQSTLSASQTDRSRHYVVDASQIGAGLQAHRLKWLCMVNGPAALAAARVADFDTLTGIYKLDRPLPTIAASGNVYRLWSKGNVWPDVSAAEAAAGHTRYRSICVRQTHGADLANARIYFRDLCAGAADFHRMHGTSSLSVHQLLSRANDTTDLYNGLGARDPLGGGDNYPGAGYWQNPLGYAVADTNVGTWFANTHLAMWLRQRIQAGAQQFRRRVAVQIIVETTTTGSDPSPMVSCCVLPFDVAADVAAPLGDIEPDRYVHVLGGARLRGTVTRGVGQPEGNRPVRWALRAGDAGTLHTDDEPFPGWATTDASGRAFATYRAPSSQAFAGANATARLLIGAGEELGDPQPRLSLQALTEDGDTVSGDLTLPSSMQSWDEDLAAGFWPAIA